MQNYYKAYMREKQARDKLEELLEEKTTKLYALNVELEKKLELLERQQVAVVQSEKMATLGTLSAGVAHEINNPLAYLTCNIDTLAVYSKDMNDYLSLTSKYIKDEVSRDEFFEQFHKLQKTTDIAELIEDLSDISQDCKEGCERISAIVKNLLDFAKPKSDSLLEFEVSDVIEHATQLLENKLKLLQLDVTCEQNLLLKGSKPNLTQALINTLVNAAQSCAKVKNADPSFRGTIQISAYKSNDKAIIRIKDNGAGLEEADINRVFDPFYSTKPLGEGTGMGLAVVYGIISNHHGTVSISNNPDSGVTLNLELPLTI
ncbi:MULTISPECIES: sensor histidine kinase [Pseudoalteromonas]|uniref:histidine kinase n=1 Tax=Pseudoalteromonas obscura TaxID=3048491 RepID=A0ABT7ENR7_9GAMM|nr:MULTISPECIES: ATP-binding protein [Pseudoalteromonas]MBQ4835291.1 GHKL domain-containing protein [Pseudoalteromonas luteoviolacea]MDK2596689.1 ATP-binding protein [Pseudoalteromonas sp. P94(2023)]